MRVQLEVASPADVLRLTTYHAFLLSWRGTRDKPKNVCVGVEANTRLFVWHDHIKSQIKNKEGMKLIVSHADITQDPTSLLLLLALFVISPLTVTH